MIALMIAVLIVSIMAYMMFKKHHTDNANQKLLNDTAVDATNYKTILDSTKQVVHDASQQK